MSDVCLIFEKKIRDPDSIPAWAQQLVRTLPRVRFSLLIVHPPQSAYLDFDCDLPSNVTDVVTVNMDQIQLTGQKSRNSVPDAFEILDRFLQDIGEGDYRRLPIVFNLLANPESRVLSPTALLGNKVLRHALTAAFEKLQSLEPLEAFLTRWQQALALLLRLAEIPVPQAALYHIAGGDYSTLLGLAAHFRTNAPLLLNERDPSDGLGQMPTALAAHIQQATYSFVDQTIALSDAQRKQHIANGANAKRTLVIPPGINPADFTAKKSPKEPEQTLQIGLVGPVAPERDIETFIRACRIVHDRLPNTYFPITGFTEQSSSYFAACRTLVEQLNLEDCVEFTGPIDLRRHYPHMDAIALAGSADLDVHPILEANVSGVPCVAPAIASCSELLNGRTAEEIALGPSGLVVPPSSPQAMADALIQLLENAPLRQRMGQSGIDRVTRFYDENDLSFRYLDLYRYYLAQSRHRRRRQRTDT